VSINAGDTVTVQAACPNTLVVVGGGAQAIGADVTVRAQFPSDGTGSPGPGTVAWAATLTNAGPSAEDAKVFAICSTASNTDTSNL
jgi:hypothetical protein